MRPLLITLLVPSPSLAATLTVGPGQDHETIESALFAAEDDDEVIISAGTYDERLLINDVDITVIGQGTVIITGSNASLLQINDAEATIENITFVPSGGRAVRSNDSEVSLVDVTIRDNNTGDAPYNGAAVAVYGGSSVSMLRCTLTNNRTVENQNSNISSGYGGTVYVVDGDLTVDDSSFTGNGARLGGAIFHSGSGTTTVRGSSFSQHATSENGGVIWFGSDANLVIENSDFSANTSDGLGGVIRWEGAEQSGTLTVTGTNFSGNQSVSYGGAIAINTGGTLVLEDNRFTGNSSNAGGAVSVFNIDSVTARRNTLCLNTAGDQGGGFRVNAVNTGTFTQNALYEHSAGAGGGSAFWIANSSQTIVNNTIMGTNSAGPGAAVLLDDADADFRNNIVAYAGSTVAVDVTDGGSVDPAYNAWYQLPGGRVAGGVGAGAVIGDPEVLSFQADGICNDAGQLRNGSPLIDAGDPDTSDPDGTVADIGAFAGDDAPGEWFEDQDGDGFAGNYDCDDGDDSVFPGATEVCDGKDTDCDGTIDSPNATGATSWYPDLDGDGFGDAAGATLVCTPPDGWVEDGTDCDDDNGAINPSSDEVCDGIDNNCDGTEDDDAVDKLTWYADADADGYGNAGDPLEACEQPEGHVSDDGDCDDNNAAISPDADELCDDLDNDCNDVVDDDAVDALIWYADEDKDGYGTASGAAEASCDSIDGYARTNNDCDDADDAIYPGAPESCDPPLVDANCDGIVGETDGDGDGFIACEDCDDRNPDAYPGAPETFYDGIIQDCNITSDFDADQDGYESDAYGGDDCDDANADINPGAVEIFSDEIDNDCDGEVGVDPYTEEDLKAACTGCSTSSQPTWWTMVLLGATMLRRRRPRDA